MYCLLKVQNTSPMPEAPTGSSIQSLSPSSATGASERSRFKSRPDQTATLTCEDGNYNVVFVQQLEFSDFPPPGVTLWFENDTIYLPSER